MAAEAEGRVTPPDAAGRRAGTLLVALLSAAYLTFLAFYVPHLTNYVYGDREFTGWVGPIAERVLEGKHLYDDLVLPIPPGSFLVLAGIQKLMGRALLLQELWVAAIAHWLMGLIAYAVAARFATRRVAVLVAAVTLVLVTQTPKVCVYDHTSLLPAWAAVWTGMDAALSPPSRRRAHMWFATGALSTFTLAFKQSTAVGCVAGWAVAFAYFFVIARRARATQAMRDVAADGLQLLGGAALGLAAVAAVVLASGASLGGFVQAVMIDGPALKGGARALLTNLFTFTARNDAIRDTLVPTAVAIAIGLGVARKHGHLHVGGLTGGGEGLSRPVAFVLAGVILLTWGTATVLLAAGVPALHRTFMATVEGLRNVPPYGFVYAMVFFVAHARGAGATTDEERRRGHALNGLLLATFVCSMIYDTSFVAFYPFYYNEPSIPVVLLCLFLATERSGYAWATPLVLVLSLLPTYGTEYNRALSARRKIESGHWAGLSVNVRGAEIASAASRARALAGEHGTVLVLPEDVELAGLIQRARPPLRGAILFVDQYPKRLLEEDLRTLDANLPDVIVIHPRRERDWRAVFKTWAEGSGTERVMNHVLRKVLPAHYQRDSSYPTTFFWDQGRLDIYRKRTQGAPDGG